MTNIDIFLLALAMAVDAVVVSFSYGLVCKTHRLKNALNLALATGLGQFIMPVLGWFGTSSVHQHIEAIDHWISFFVFLGLGLKVISDALKDEEDEALSCSLSISTLLAIGLATSIDAFVAGVSIYFMPVSILYAATVIGVVTFISSISAFVMSRITSNLPTKYLELFAGCVLILLGVKVLWEHIG